jgi:hypothetical protein
MMTRTQIYSPLVAVLTLFLCCSTTWASLLLLTDFRNERVLEYNFETGAFRGVFADLDDGGATNERPIGIAAGDRRAVYVASFDEDHVIRYRYDGANPTVVVDSSDGLDGPTGMAFGPDGNLYLNSMNTDEVLKYDVAADTTSVFADFQSTGGTRNGLTRPRGLAFDAAGDLYVANQNDGGDQGNNVLRFHGPGSGTPGDPFPSAADGAVFLQLDDEPLGLTFRLADDHLFVTQRDDNEVAEYSGTTFIGNFVDSDIDNPLGVGFFDSELFVASFDGDELQVFDADGEFDRTFAPAGAEVLDGPAYFIRFTPIPEPSTLLVWSLLAAAGVAAGLRRRKTA